MKFLGYFLSLCVVLFSCKTRIDPDTLPKDFSLKPKIENKKDSLNGKTDLIKNNDITEKRIQDLRNEIEDLINSVACTHPDEWRISPIGAKPCGGPAKYIAYPKSKENIILEKIHTYTSEQDKYNKANGLTSDCSMVLPPSKILCKNGHPILINDAGIEQ